MSRIVVGVDNLGAHRPVLGLLERLRFPEARLTLIHAAAESLPLVTTFERAPNIEEEYAKVAMNLGQVALHEATALAGSRHLPCDTKLTHGNAANRLICEAEAEGADLIAINTKRQGVARSSYVGSVAQALVVGSRTSVLIAKGEQGKRGVFRAVFATDHSPFSMRCLERFLELRPAGIEEIAVVSAWDLDDHAATILRQNLAKLGGDADRWVEETIEARNAEVCARIEAAGYRTRSLVWRGQANEVIHRAMAEIRADLLIVGSQGSGAMERSLVGSVSLHQTVAEFYPVLIVRPKEA